jgi:hypothetical protein
MNLIWLKAGLHATFSRFHPLRLCLPLPKGRQFYSTFFRGMQDAEDAFYWNGEESAMFFCCLSRGNSVLGLLV